MDANFANLLIFLARLSQVACGLIVLSFSIAATGRSEEYGSGYDDHDKPLVSVFLGAGIALLGAFGLFGCRRRRVDEEEQGRLTSLILFIDCWALMLCLAAGILLAIQGSDWQNDYIGPDALLYVPAAFSFVCGAGIIFPLIVRTFRIWWKMVLYSDRPPAAMDKAIALESAYAHTCCHQHHHSQNFELGHVDNREPRQSYQTDGVKTTFSSRPQSVISGTDTLTYPNIGNVAQTGAPSLAPSHAAPSYTSRVEVGSKVGKN